MGGDAAAFAALGLEPGADRDAVERAYKRLIKDHHPDRAGGNAERAAEITRAYRELREGRAVPNGLEFHDEVARARGSRFGAWLPFMLALAAASLALWFAAGRQVSLVERSLVGPVRTLALGARAK